MKKSDLPIASPCGVDWSTMSATEARARLCAHCDSLVHDLSAMSEGEARAVLAGGPACVRYLYDGDGNVLFGAEAERPFLVPARALLDKRSQQRWARAAALAGSLMALEACGGASPHAVRPDPVPAFDEPRDDAGGSAEGSDAAAGDVPLPEGDGGAG